MKTDDFDFDLPTDLIAQHPARPRDSARLLVVGPRLEDRSVSDLPEMLAPGDLLVLNNTEVVPSRLTGRRGEARIEVTLHKMSDNGRWRAFAKPGRKLKPGSRINFADGLSADVVAKLEGGEIVLAFDRSEAELQSALKAQGAMPLPPYIKRQAGGDPEDRQDYQTMFARSPGAVAAPTAALHFTPALVSALAVRGIETAELTLHVGAGTFLPVKTDDPTDHRMHAETGHLDDEAAAKINAARARGGRIVALGTTALRLLESAADEDGRVRPFHGETDIFILPGYRFRAVDQLMTNFHLPRSTLFMLVSAFAGQARMREAYRHAIASRYRFYSYGDACLLAPEQAT